MSVPSAWACQPLRLWCPRSRCEESGCLERCSRLIRPGGVVDVEFTRRARAPIVDLDAAREPQAAMRRRAEQGLPERGFGLAAGDRLEAAAVVARADRADIDRQHVVWGKRLSVRVELGGRRLLHIHNS